MTKVICKKQALEMGLKKYFTGKPCKYGHVAERYVSTSNCLECKEEYERERYKQNKNEILQSQKEYRKQNKEKISAYKKKYRQENKIYFKEYLKDYRQQNKEQILYSKKEYYQQNKEQIKEYNKEYQRRRYTTDNDYRASCICRNMLTRTLKATESTKDSRTHELLGYCNEELKESVESKFLQGMTWDNYGDWHIDHIYPITRYIKDGITDPTVINSLENLIPMWADHNHQKNDKTLKEYLEEEPHMIGVYGHFLAKERTN